MMVGPLDFDGIMIAIFLDACAIAWDGLRRAVWERRWLSQKPCWEWWWLITS